MKKIQRGFTLIELMIVIAIIGILAAVAIPSYSDYTARAQVTEAMSLASSMKTALAEFYSDNGSFVPGNGVALVPTYFSQSVSGKYVSAMSFGGATGATIYVNATMKGTGVNAGVANGVFAMSTVDGGLNWLCGTLSFTAAGNTLQTKYLPGACK